MAPLKVIKGQRACQYMAGGMLDSIRYEGDLGILSLLGHVFVNPVEQFRVGGEFKAQVQSRKRNFYILKKIQSGKNSNAFVVNVETVVGEFDTLIFQLVHVAEHFLFIEEVDCRMGQLIECNDQCLVEGVQGFTAFKQFFGQRIINESGLLDAYEATVEPLSFAGALEVFERKGVQPGLHQCFAVDVSRLTRRSGGRCYQEVTMGPDLTAEGTVVARQNQLSRQIGTRMVNARRAVYGIHDAAAPLRRNQWIEIKPLINRYPYPRML